MIRFSLGLLFSASLVLVPSLGFYVGNTGVFAITPSTLLLSLLAITAALSLLVAGLLALTHRSPLWSRVLPGLLVGLSAALLIQGNFYVWDFGPLDGRGIRWGDWDKVSAIELATWASLLGAFTFLGLRKPQFVLAVHRLLLVICLAFVAVSLSKMEFSAPERSPHAPVESPFTFHQSNNKLLIILDTMQADIFSDIMNRYPAELEFLQGFTFYPDTVGGYPTTRVSVPLMLTGKFYRNEGTIKDWIAANMVGQTIIDFLEGQDFGTSIVLNAAPKVGISQPGAYMSLVKYNPRHRFRAELLPVIDAGLFRAAPTLLKPHIYQRGNWLLLWLFEDWSEPPGDHRADLHFRKAMEQNFSVGSTRDGEFKYFHFRGAHKPIQVNERFEYEPGLPYDRESFTLQSRGVLHNLERFLAPLKQAGLYESAEILIAGDHGSLSIDATDYFNKDGNVEAIEAKILSSARPLFLYKPAGASGDLKVSEESLHLADIPCILSNSPTLCTELSQNIGSIDEQRTRSYYFYNWIGGMGFWNDPKMPVMTEYRIRGDVRDRTSWSLGWQEEPRD